jgi:YegS/Rv2252/BmrU family lipid kinase
MNNIPHYRNIHVIINPAAGRDKPILNTLNDVFRQYQVNWEVRITKKFGDATEFAMQAVANGADLVAGYGGDGTQMEVANGLLGSNVPLAILPGGTGNAMAFALHIPRELRAAVELVCQSSALRKIDLGQIGERYFMLRLYTGANKDKVASRTMKDKYGLLAYPLASIRTVQDMRVLPHHITVDGDSFEVEAFVCLIQNTGVPGGVNFPDHPEVDPGDGYLDLIMLNKTLQSLKAFASYRLDIGDAKGHVQHWRAKEITVQVDPPQSVWLDGEEHGTTPFTARVLPSAIQIVVPQPGE